MLRLKRSSHPRFQLNRSKVKRKAKALTAFQKVALKLMIANLCIGERYTEQRYAEVVTVTMNFGLFSRVFGQDYKALYDWFTGGLYSQLINEVVSGDVISVVGLYIFQLALQIHVEKFISALLSQAVNLIADYNPLGVIGQRKKISHEVSSKVISEADEAAELNARGIAVASSEGADSLLKAITKTTKAEYFYEAFSIVALALCCGIDMGLSPTWEAYFFSLLEHPTYLWRLSYLIRRLTDYIPPFIREWFDVKDWLFNRWRHDLIYFRKLFLEIFSGGFISDEWIFDQGHRAFKYEWSDSKISICGNEIHDRDEIFNLLSVLSKISWLKMSISIPEKSLLLVYPHYLSKNQWAEFEAAVVKSKPVNDEEKIKKPAAQLKEPVLLNKKESSVVENIISAPQAFPDQSAYLSLPAHKLIEPQYQKLPTRKSDQLEKIKIRQKRSERKKQNMRAAIRDRESLSSTASCNKLPESLSDSSTKLSSSLLPFTLFAFLKKPKAFCGDVSRKILVDKPPLPIMVVEATPLDFNPDKEKIKHLLYNPHVKFIFDLLGKNVWLTGGAIRSKLQDKEARDLDWLTALSVDELQQQFLNLPHSHVCVNAPVEGVTTVLYGDESGRLEFKASTHMPNLVTVRHVIGGQEMMAMDIVCDRSLDTLEAKQREALTKEVVATTIMMDCDGNIEEPLPGAIEDAKADRLRAPKTWEKSLCTPTKVAATSRKDFQFHNPYRIMRMIRFAVMSNHLTPIVNESDCFSDYARKAFVQQSYLDCLYQVRELIMLTEGHHAKLIDVLKQQKILKYELQGDLNEYNLLGAITRRFNHHSRQSLQENAEEKTGEGAYVPTLIPLCCEDQHASLSQFWHSYAVPTGVSPYPSPAYLYTYRT